MWKKPYEIKEIKYCLYYVLDVLDDSVGHIVAYSEHELDDRDKKPGWKLFETAQEVVENFAKGYNTNLWSIHIDGDKVSLEERNFSEVNIINLETYRPIDQNEDAKTHIRWNKKSGILAIKIDNFERIPEVYTPPLFLFICNKSDPHIFYYHTIIPMDDFNEAGIYLQTLKYSFPHDAVMYTRSQNNAYNLEIIE